MQGGSRKGAGVEDIAGGSYIYQFSRDKPRYVLTHLFHVPLVDLSRPIMERRERERESGIIQLSTQGERMESSRLL